MRIKDPPMSKDDFRSAKKILFGSLSEFEKSVCKAYLRMDTYKKMAEDIGCSNHAISNALVRIRRKAVKSLKEGKFDHLKTFREFMPV